MSNLSNGLGGSGGSIAGSLSDDIPVKSNDATGAAGSSLKASRSDHKHPAQMVSADANNILTNGTDGLAYAQNSNIDHDQLTNFVANEHIDHTTVSLTAGSGIKSTGLGDITASRTINIDVAIDADVTAQTANKILDATRVIDEDSFASDSSVKVPTQQSVKAYIANQVAGGVTYRGALIMPCDLTTNSTGNAYADGSNAYKVGDLFVASSSGILTLSDGTINVQAGDALIINTNIDDASITIAAVDDIQATNPSDKVFTGDYKQSAKSSDHGSWLLCNGIAISRSTYAALFTEIGITFGAGDGSTTFNLPDFRGKVFGAISGSHPIGQSTGSETSNLLISNLPSHTHTIDHDHPSFTSGSGGDENISNGEFGLIRKSAGESNTTDGVNDTTAGEPDLVTSPSGWAHTHTIDVPSFSGTSGSAGSGTAFSIMQPTLFGGNVFIYSGF